MRLLSFAAPVLLLAALAGCDRRTAAWVPIEQEPPFPTKPVRIPGLEMAKASAPMRDASPMPEESAPDESAAAGAQEGTGLSGTIRLAEGAKLPSGGVLFLIARTGPPPQPPLAVKRLPPGPFPLEFSIGPSDVMIPGRKFAGPITVTARLDLDGDPMSRSADDLAGEVAQAVQPGTSGIEITLGAGSR